MTIALAATFNPRGETGRLERYYPQLQRVFSAIIISLPPAAPAEDLERVKALPGVQAMWREAWLSGRYQALKAALETGADYYQYADLDRLIRWVETRPQEWLQTVERIQQTDCLVIGRTEAAWATHPKVMVQVEKVINDVFSFHLGQALDFGAGSKGFSKRAAELIVANSEPESPIGSDTEWPILCYRAGLKVEGLLVDGLDWEIPDQYQESAANSERQRLIAEQYDAEVKHWRFRVGTTIEAVESGLKALNRPLNGIH